MSYDLKTLFSSQQKQKYRLRKSSAKERISKLLKLKAGIAHHEQELCDALQKDLRKSSFEAAVTEVLFIYGEIDFAVKHLNSWMKPKKTGATLRNLFAKNRCHFEPRGVCLIISPWNYPFQLMMSPLVSAIAAGNCAILKPSELSPATAAVLSNIISGCFPEEEIRCLLGGSDLASELLRLPFDHIFFTGSTTIGKIIMEAAAKNLSSLTLELGGKSPVVIDHTADLKKAAEKIAWGKLINAGQTCIAPDYILIPQELQDSFIEHYKRAAESMFFHNGQLNTNNYAKIINEKHFERLCGLLTDALSEGATLAYGGATTPENLTVHPSLLTNLSPRSKIMQEEVFGPLLLLIPYRNIDDAIHTINQKDKPLALYIFSKDPVVTQEIIRNTSAGGTCVNDVLLHISNPKLPFGGTGKSGMGSCHGIYGFKAFSHERAVVYQSRIDFTSLIYPPYEKKEWLLKWLKKLI